MGTRSAFSHHVYANVGNKRRAATGAARASRRRPATTPRLETLEERHSPSSYNVFNLGSLGGTLGLVLDINRSGAVVGGSFTAGNNAEHAFLYSHGHMTDLGTLGGSLSQAYGINDAGKVVGVATTAPGSFQNSMFVFSHGHMTNLGTIDQSKPPSDIKINNHGDMIGLPLGNGDASLIARGHAIDLGSLAGLGSGARALTDKDEVVGYSAISQSGSTMVVHAFVYNHGHMGDLGTLGGSSSVANDVNSRGQIVGESNTTSGDVHGFLVTRGHMKDLGTLGGTESDAGAINNSGEVVGWSLTSSGARHGFLFKNGKMLDLNSMISPNSGFVIIGAEDINDHGQIAAEAVSTNSQDLTQYVVLLNPKGPGR
jgi:probable HAF family extracellular repeat protein